jgi:alginate O-acetyltransferase complex protein AlgI
MQFNSIQFLFIFLPVFLLVYYVVPAKWRNLLLLAGSVVFYRLNINELPWVTTCLLLLLTLYAYLMGLLLYVWKNKVLFLFNILFLVGLMVFFKCFDGGKLMPVGFSYYMFQLAAYLIAVYSDKMEPDKNPIDFSSQIFMFPKILIGPIADPKRLQLESHERNYHPASFHHGLQLLIIGLAMQVLLANRIKGLWSQAAVVGYESISTPYAWLALLGFTMNLYFNFYGYSLMAMGIGEMLGFHLPTNFDTPYASRSVAEFYRRWHISLGAWFRENVYIPMGGNRGSMGKTICNLLVVWVLTGLWHGVGGNYLLWAGILVFFIILERLWLRTWLDKSHVLSRVYTVFVILLSWVPFAIGDWTQMTVFYGRLFGLAGQTINPQDYLQQWDTYSTMIIGGLILATPLPQWICSKLRKYWIADVALFVLFWVVVYFMVSSAQDPFTYY